MSENSSGRILQVSVSYLVPKHHNLHNHIKILLRNKRKNRTGKVVQMKQFENFRNLKIQREKRKPINLGFNFIDMCHYNDLELILVLLPKFLLSQGSGLFFVVVVCFVLAFEVGT